MSPLSLVASIEKRLDALVELSRRNQRINVMTDRAPEQPTITISREFGCEGLPVAARVQMLLQERTGVSWGILDRATLDKMAQNRDVSEEIFRNLGGKNRFLDEAMSTILTDWTSDKDYYQHLCNQIIPFARAGHVIIIGVGAGILTQKMSNCHKFRIVAPMEFKVKSFAQRHHMSEDEAFKLIVKQQKQRNAFITDFLDRDVTDPTLYDVIFNRATNSVDQIAEMICYHIQSGQRKA
ncbi:cytidylate kinase [Geomonas silvestris]|uniref:Cytidylate kinase n=1 Tax=Geomonas silvestris TaxID=2740184 RepID=A0A6V8ME77_9BACT|nr:cytidylate kinase-like family protein [Geomonas silvestris]GFO58296.1 cytidylate kinase [Geomonas silvestris]